MARRTIVWVKDDPLGAEFAEVTIQRRLLLAAGIAIGSTPVGYRLDYQLVTGPGYVTKELIALARGRAWWRRLDLSRSPSGEWKAERNGVGRLNMPGSRIQMSAVEGALDCDLALSPLTNTMPVLRHGLLGGGEPLEFLMAWVSVPDLRVYPSRQRYTHMRKTRTGSSVRYESSSRDFVADLTFDQDGLCLDYPGIGRSV